MPPAAQVHGTPRRLCSNAACSTQHGVTFDTRKAHMKHVAKFEAFQQGPDEDESGPRKRLKTASNLDLHDTAVT
eukprot:8702151-Alexandrium_andersonii.AAC.1